MNKSESLRMTGLYRQLILDCITEEAPKDNQMKWVKERFEAEMLGNNRDFSQQLVLDWIAGLCSTVSVPFYNNEIIELVEKHIGRELLYYECEAVIDDHFRKCAQALTFLWSR